LVPKQDGAMMQKQQLLKRRTLQLAVRLSKEDYSKIEQLVEAGLYKNFASFLREAIQDKLGSMEVVSVQKVDLVKAERMIVDYLTKHPGPSYASEIADALGLEYGITFKTVQKLLEEGQIKRAKK